MKLKQAFLIVASCVVFAIALLYGVSPHWFAQTLLGLETLDREFTHILRAVMGLYLAFSCFWLYAAFSNQHRNTAVLTTIFFGSGLWIGRVLSLMVDGRPAQILLVYLLLEMTLVPLAWWIYRLPE